MAQLRGLRARPAPGPPARAAAGSLLLALLLAAVPAAGQEPDTLPPADTLPPPDTVPGAGQDTVPAGPPARLPELVTLPEEFAAFVREWDREALLNSTALSLADLLADEIPELTFLRAGYFAGPHHVSDGLFGGSFLEVRVDGRELQPLASGQVDLARVSLARLERVRVIRGPARLVVEVATLRHDRPDAYSRIEAGTGQPDVDVLRGVFTNGFGDDFAVGAAVDFLNVGLGPMPADRFDFSGSVSFATGDRSAGVELLWRNESVTRTTDETRAFGRGDVYLHGRASLGEGVQTDLWLGTSSRSPESGEDAEPEPGAEADLSVSEAQLGLTAAGERAFLEGGIQLRESAAHARLDLRSTVGVRVAPALLVDVTGRFATWESFRTGEVGAGLTLDPDLGLGTRLRGSVATGTRGVSRPRRNEALSVAYDALTVVASLAPGPYRLSERIVYQHESRQIPFGGFFDEELRPGPPVEGVGFESRIEGPLLPVGTFEERFRIEGVWRRNPIPASEARHLPVDLTTGRIAYRERLFDDNLEVRLDAALGFRSRMVTARPGSDAPEPVPARTLLGGGLSVRVDTFRIWWRLGNALLRQRADFAGLPQPQPENVFGVKWEFFN